MKDKMTFVIVDDSSESLTMASYLLSNFSQHQIILCKSGKEAVSVFKSTPVHLLILDWQMPTLTGRQTLEEIDNVWSHPIKSTDVIIYTGSELGLIEFPKMKHLKVRKIISKRSTAHQQLLLFKDTIETINQGKKNLKSDIKAA